MSGVLRNMLGLNLWLGVSGRIRRKLLLLVSINISNLDHTHAYPVSEVAREPRQGCTCQLFNLLQCFRDFLQRSEGSVREDFAHCFSSTPLSEALEALQVSIELHHLFTAECDWDTLIPPLLGRNSG